MVVIQDWDDSSLAQYDDALDAAAAAPPPAAGAADGAATHVTGECSSRVRAARCV